MLLKKVNLRLFDRDKRPLAHTDERNSAFSLQCPLQLLDQKRRLCFSPLHSLLCLFLYSRTSRPCSFSLSHSLPVERLLIYDPTSSPSILAFAPSHYPLITACVAALTTHATLTSNPSRIQPSSSLSHQIPPISAFTFSR